MTELRLPPQDIEAEQSVLGAILMDRRALDVARDILREEDFYYDKHRLVFRASCSLVDAGTAVDCVTVYDALKDEERKAVGGMAGIAELVAVVPTAVNVKSHAEIVKDKSQARNLIAVGSAVCDMAYGGNDAERIQEYAEQALFRVGHRSQGRTFHAIGKAAEAAYDRIEQLSKRGLTVTGIPTGLAAVDRLTAGWQAGDLVIVAGRPSMGKTAFLLASVLAAARAGHPAAVFTLEMSVEQLALRALAMVSQIDVHCLRIGQLVAAGWHHLAHGMMQLAPLPVLLDEHPVSSMASLCAAARRLRSQGKLNLLAIDYLQLISTEDARGLSRHQELSRITKACKLLAKELQIPVLLLSQLNRELERREDKRPILADLRESGSIEEDADLACFLYRHEVYCDEPEFKGKAQLLIRKHRNGPTGEVDLNWIEHLAMFTDAV